MDPSTYIDDSELTKYVWNNYQHLFSELEQRGVKAVIANEKAGRSASVAMATVLRERWGSANDPEVAAALGEGTEVFQRRVRERVVRECEGNLFINRCPACNRIVRTPRARQCLWCNHAWHENTL